MSLIHYFYYKFLERCADTGAVKNFNGDYDNLVKTLATSNERVLVDWIKGYLLGEHRYLYAISIVMESFVKKLNYIPRKIDLESLWIHRERIDFESVVEKYIRDKSDFKYLESCRKNFKETLSNNITITRAVENIKFYGPVGTTGYSKACKDLLNCILLDKNISMTFEVVQYQNYLETNSKIISNVCRAEKKYKYIIIHSTPELWPVICNIERKINPKVIIYGITVWETEDFLPHRWDLYCQFVDKVSVPSEFSSLAFKRAGIKTDVVCHPVEKTLKTDKGCCFLKNKRYSYIFYNISEWTNRKGITELIQLFLECFREKPDVLLYIKTFGDTSEKESKVFMKKLGDPVNVIIEYGKVSDSYIDCIHDCGNCYVSFCKSEGQGIGACQAALSGNHIIITGYSGHLDYLKEVSLVEFTLEPASFCCAWNPKHFDCKYLPHCRFFDGFCPSRQKWAKIDTVSACEKMLSAFENTLSGNKDTIEYINTNFSYKKVSETLLTSLRNTKRICSKTRKQNIKDRAYTEILKSNCIEQGSILDFKESKKKLVVLNAGGYGNVGDDAYSFIINLKFKETCEISFVSDFTFEKFITDFDYLIIGGGGLLNTERMRQDNNIWRYSDYASKNGKPYFLTSIGFQDTEVNSEEESLEKYRVYGKLLDNSDYISVRSVSDYHIACRICYSKTKDFLYFNQDIVYSINNYMKLDTFQERDTLLVIIDKWVNPFEDFVYNDILKKKNGLQIVFTEFSGENENFIVDPTLLLKLFPDSVFIPGIPRKNEIDKNNSRVLNATCLLDICKILVRSKIVITGRYHGMILSKVFKVPSIETYGYSNYKLEAEKFAPPTDNKDTALDKILEIIDSGYIFKSRNWTQDDRNTAIVQANTVFGISIQKIQNWSNRKIEEKLLSK